MSLSHGMLRIRAQERLSAGACLTKGREVRLFDKLSLDSGGTTPTQTKALASGAQKEDAGRALWNYDDDDDRTGRSISECRPATSRSRQFQVSRSQNNEGIPRPLKETPEAVSGRSSTGPLSSSEIRPTFFGSKRNRSRSLSNSSDENKVKRRRSESHSSKFHTSGASKVSSAFDGDTKKSKSDGSGEGDDSTEDDEPSVNVDITQLPASQSDESDGEMLSRT